MIGEVEGEYGIGDHFEHTNSVACDDTISTHWVREIPREKDSL